MAQVFRTGDRDLPTYRGTGDLAGTLWEQGQRASQDKAQGERVKLAAKHREEIERLIPLTLELARKAGPQGVTAGNIRLAAERRGLLEQGTGRSLSSGNAPDTVPALMQSNPKT